MSNPAVGNKTWRLENIHTEPQEELRLIHAGFVRKLSDWKVVSSIQNFCPKENQTIWCGASNLSLSVCL